MRAAPGKDPVAALRGLIMDALPGPIAGMLRRARRSRIKPAIGEIDFGDLAKVKPLSDGFGMRRGTPIDRYYIEGFIARHRVPIAGHVLEVDDTSYSTKYGTGIARQDVLSLYAGPGVTIVGDLAVEGLLPAAAFDCIIFTQTLQYIYDPGAALNHLRQSLKPGGVLLATIPYISPFVKEQWQRYWSFTPRAVERLFRESFGDDNFEMGVHGNVFAATCFLQGASVEDVSASMLEPIDPDYPVSITVRAVRPT